MTIVIMLLIKKKQKKVIEINMANRRLRIFSGRIKKKGKSVKRFWSQKIGRSLPEFQQKSIYVKGQQDTVILLKDNNGMYHTARIPTQKEISHWYKVMYDVDLDDTANLTEAHKKLRSIYLLPTPHEDLDWLSNQVIESDSEFKNDNWWQSPNVMVIGTAFICFLMIIVSQILKAKL